MKVPEHLFACIFYSILSSAEMMALIVSDKDQDWFNILCHTFYNFFIVCNFAYMLYYDLDIYIPKYVVYSGAIYAGLTSWTVMRQYHTSSIIIQVFIHIESGLFFGLCLTAALYGFRKYMRNQQPIQLQNNGVALRPRPELVRQPPPPRSPPPPQPIAYRYPDLPRPLESVRPELVRPPPQLLASAPYLDIEVDDEYQPGARNVEQEYYEIVRQVQAYNLEHPEDQINLD